jgi:hypothetical protein
MFGWSYLAGRGGVRGFYGRVMVMVNCFCCYPAFFSFFIALPVAIYHPATTSTELGGGICTEYVWVVVFGGEGGC